MMEGFLGPGDWTLATAWAYKAAKECQECPDFPSTSALVTYLPVLLCTKMMALLALTLALMGVSAVRQADSQPLRTEAIELTELLALLRAVGPVARPVGEEAALAAGGYPGDNGGLFEGEQMDKRDLPRLGVSIFRSNPSRVTNSKTYKDTGKCRTSYMHERGAGIQG
ncbi:hypothetical protein AALO_G00053680 [Alosa alosa]|uniref:Uncharacterized protein n=1 Tax=Alosa alosa TaxID=278164 RepID=A0AAV6H7W6_9TELE|nr:hypothetical protein AALO_G00053680 [Alosa alosa]